MKKQILRNDAIDNLTWDDGNEHGQQEATMGLNSRGDTLPQGSYKIGYVEGWEFVKRALKKGYLVAGQF